MASQDPAVGSIAAPGMGMGRPAILAALAMQLGGVVLFAATSWRLALLFLVGAALGLCLYHGAVSFSAAFRSVILRRSSDAAGGVLLVLAATLLLFAPTLEVGSIFGRPVSGAAAPLGFQVAIGSFAFGVGMQLAGGCASGTLYAAGGGSIRMILVLVAFSAGGFIATFDLGAWKDLPATTPIVLGRELGWLPGTMVQLGVIGALWLAMSRWVRRGRVATLRARLRQPPLGLGELQADRLRPWPPRLLTGPWPIALAALCLAALNWTTMALTGHPWTITWGFTLWSAEAALALGWDPSTSTFWSVGFPADALQAGVLEDTTSVMNIGIVLGAMAAAGLAGRFGLRRKTSWRGSLAAILGGLLMGYGARIAYGCNIGAFLDGVASTSLHGWLWLLGALIGSWLGVHLRPGFHLRN